MIGKTGVGKSTLTNALCNPLPFEYTPAPRVVEQTTMVQKTRKVTVKKKCKKTRLVKTKFLQEQTKYEDKVEEKLVSRTVPEPRDELDFIKVGVSCVPLAYFYS